MQERSGFFRNPAVRVALGVIGGVALWFKWDRPFGATGVIVAVAIFVCLGFITLLSWYREEESGPVLGEEEEAEP